MDMGFQERVALVTGSSQGIGRATARLLAREGARVVVTYRHHRDQADAVAAEIQSTGGEAMVAFFDLASDEAIRAAVDAILQQWGRIDILVNNAVAWGSRPPSQAPRSLSDKRERVMMVCPLTVTARLSGRSRAPAQSGQVWVTKNSSSLSR